jgi:hypothetical protein
MGTRWTRGKELSILNKKVVNIIPQPAHPRGMSSRYALKRKMYRIQRQFGRQENRKIYYRCRESSPIP